MWMILQVQLRERLLLDILLRLLQRAFLVLHKDQGTSLLLMLVMSDLAVGDLLNHAGKMLCEKKQAGRKERSGRKTTCLAHYRVWLKVA